MNVYRWRCLFPRLNSSSYWFNFDSLKKQKESRQLEKKQIESHLLGNVNQTSFSFVRRIVSCHWQIRYGISSRTFSRRQDGADKRKGRGLSHRQLSDRFQMSLSAMSNILKRKSEYAHDYEIKLKWLTFFWASIFQGRHLSVIISIYSCSVIKRSEGFQKSVFVIIWIQMRNTWL